MNEIKILNDINWLRDGQASAAFGDLAIAHGFVGRQPGASPPPEAHFGQQVHGTKVIEAAMGATDTQAVSRHAADGVYTFKPGTTVAVRTADCLPVLFADSQGQAVAAVHAGWRGLTAGILGQAQRTLATHGVTAARWRVVIGPAISGARYEVGSEVIDALAGPTFGLTSTQAALCISKGSGDRWHADLLVAAVFALNNCGIQPRHIAALQACTYGSSNWHSYRRDGKGVGSNWSWIRL